MQDHRSVTVLLWGLVSAIWLVAAACRPQNRGLSEAGLEGELPKSFESSVPGLKLVRIKAGTFIMGSPASEENRFENEVEHQVTLTRDFYIGATEITQGQYETVTGRNPSEYSKGVRDAPVASVSWDQAVEFCRQLTMRDHKANRLPKGWKYRLPTEAEWEYACRAGTKSAIYSLALDDIAWNTNNSRQTTHPVGEKLPNSWGVYDMMGNVWEWCLDQYGEYAAELNPLLSLAVRRIWPHGRKAIS